MLGPDGRRRLDRVSFAAHFDMHMFGRRGIPRPPDEASLDPYRQRFVDQLRRLRRLHGVRTFAAHNMTVTPANLGQVADVVRLQQELADSTVYPLRIGLAAQPWGQDLDIPDPFGNRLIFHTP